MQKGYTNLWKYSLCAAVLAVMPLSACSSSNLFSTSTYGSNQTSVAQLPESANYTADAALFEARNHFRDNDYGYSAAYYKKVVELSPTNREGYVGLAASYDRLGRFDLSDRVYASLYKLSGGNAQYFNNVGYSYMLRGDLKSALVNFRKASALDPQNVVITNNIQLLSEAAASARA